jgi:acetyl-CoA carboxylase biotin carboxyl carrier protein
MVGRVTESVVEPGTRVALQDELIVIESMKMETPARAPGGGIVQDVRVSTGETVQEGDLLVTIAT